MPQDAARFAASPINAGLAAREGGLTVTSLAAGSLSRSARSDVAHIDGLRGVEFTFWGDDDLQAIVGLIRASTLSTYLGSAGGNSIGWRLHTGEIWFDGAVVQSGLPLVGKGEIVGIRISFGTPHSVRFYKGSTLVHTMNVTLADAVYFGVSLATTTAGGLVCAVNAGQYQAISPAATAGWPAAAATQASAKLADYDYLSASTDAPAHARYEGLLLTGVTTAAEIGFWPWSGDPPTRGGTASADIVDPDGLLDGLALDDLRGTPVAIKLANSTGTVAGATTVGRYVVERIEIRSDSTKQLLLNDAHDDLDTSLARGVFLGNLPALAWTPQPVVIGAVASVPALPANSDGSVLFIADAPLAEVNAVLDRGDLMEPGTFTVTPDAQQIYMTSPPVGPVVCDVSSIGAGMQPATLLQFLHAIFGRIGKSSWSSADATAIDSATGYAGIGYYTRDAGEPGWARTALSRALPSFGAWWWQDDDGTLRFSRVIAPETFAGPMAFELDRAELQGDIVCTPDLAPNLTRRMAYRPNAQALGAGELVTDVVDLPQSRRDELMGLWRGQVYAGGALPRRYRHADSAEPIVSLLWRSQDAQTEIDRVVGMYGTPRFTVVLRLKAGSDFNPKPGQVGKLTHPRYGFASGKQLLVRARMRNPSSGETTLILWG